MNGLCGIEGVFRPYRASLFFGPFTRGVAPGYHIASFQDFFLARAIQKKFGTPGRIRTFDLRFRKPSLYPAELREHEGILPQGGGFEKKSSQKAADSQARLSNHRNHWGLIWRDELASPRRGIFQSTCGRRHTRVCRRRCGRRCGRWYKQGRSSSGLGEFGLRWSE